MAGMKAGELIAALSALPKEAIVIVHIEFDGGDTLVMADAEAIEFGHSHEDDAPFVRITAELP